LKAVLPRNFKLLLKATTLEPVELLKLVLLKVTFEFSTITVTPTESVLSNKYVYVQFKKFRLETHGNVIKCTWKMLCSVEEVTTVQD